MGDGEQLDSLDVEGILVPRSIIQRCAEHILDAQDEVLYVDERVASPNRCEG